MGEIFVMENDAPNQWSGFGKSLDSDSMSIVLGLTLRGCHKRLTDELPLLRGRIGIDLAWLP